MFLNLLDTVMVGFAKFIARILFPGMIDKDPIEEHNRMSEFIRNYFGDCHDD